MKTILLAFSMLLSLNAISQTSATTSHRYDVTTDSKTGYTIYKGPVTIDELRREPNFSWMKKADGYQADREAVEFLGKYLPKYQLLVFLGTWCTDSHKLIPKLVRVLEDAHATGRLTMYGVDRDKWSGNGENKKYSITSVPTFIILKEGKEIGRITENPNESIETDLSWIIDRDMRASR
ncbi:MAG: thioredoxin family protein [Bacteroidota bacterium]